MLGHVRFIIKAIIHKQTSLLTKPSRRRRVDRITSYYIEYYYIYV